MKVKDLITKLKTFDPDTIVVTRGMDEEGFANVKTVETIYISERKSDSAKMTFGEFESSKKRELQAILVDHS